MSCHTLASFLVESLAPKDADLREVVLVLGVVALGNAAVRSLRLAVLDGVVDRSAERVRVVVGRIALIVVDRLRSVALIVSHPERTVDWYLQVIGAQSMPLCDTKTPKMKKLNCKYKTTTKKTRI